jgi:putative transposase
MDQKRPRLKSFDYLGVYRYFLTFCTHSRRPLFTSSETVDDVLAQILRAADRCGFAIHAYVFMHDHVHLLVEGTTDASDLREFVKKAKQFSGYAHAQKRKDRLWQPSYFDHVLRDEESTARVLAYIMNNPLRAGYSTQWGEYRHIGSATMAMENIAEMLTADPEPAWEPEWQA